MAPLGPLTTNRLTVRLDPERAARIEYWASENPLRIKSYNQLVQEALDEYIDRNTPSPNEAAPPQTPLANREYQMTPARDPKQLSLKKIHLRSPG